MPCFSQTRKRTGRLSVYEGAIAIGRGGARHAVHHILTGGSGMHGTIRSACRTGKHGSAARGYCNAAMGMDDGTHRALAAKVIDERLATRRRCSGG